jgi:hypothetical protein
VQTYRLSPDAFDAYRGFQAWYESSKADERLLQAGNTFMTAFGKLEGTAGRLALVFHIIEDPFSPTVSADIIHRVIGFIRGYLIQAYRYAFGEIGGTSPFESWVVDYIIHYCDQADITLSDLKRGARRQLEGVPAWTADQWVLGAMQGLESAGWVARLDDGARETQHFAKWAINPQLKNEYSEHRAQVIGAKQRQLDGIYKLSTKEKPLVHGSRGVDGDDD